MSLINIAWGEYLCGEEIDQRLGCWAGEEVVCQAHHGNFPVADYNGRWQLFCLGKTGV